jgi:hypothetical protein
MNTEKLNKKKVKKKEKKETKKGLELNHIVSNLTVKFR